MTAAAGAPGRLRAVDGAALVISTVIGAGIFTVPSIVASLTGSATAFLAVWVVGGLLALAGSLTYAELASRMPEAGGEYVYLRRAFGPLTGFLSGWTSFVAGFSGAIAASAVGFAAYLGALIPAVGVRPWIVLDAGLVTVTASPTTVLALAIIVAFTIVAVRGVDAGRRATNGLAALLVVAIVVFIGAGWLLSSPSPPPGALSFGGAAGTAAALVPVMFTYSGWNAAAYVASEFREPRRTVPRALLGGTLVVIVLYVGVNATYLRSLGLSGVSASSAPASATSEVAAGAMGASLVTALVLLALASSVCAMVVTGPRIYMRMARDGAMPRLFAATRARDGNPVASIVAQSLWSSVLVLTGTFEALVTYTGVAIVLFSAGAVASLFVIRRREVAVGYRTPGYPVVPLVFLLASAWMIAATARREPGATLAGIGLIVAGVPLYAWQRRRARATTRHHLSPAPR